MTDSEKLKIALEMIERLADNEHMNQAAANYLQYGRAGGPMALESVQKYAIETLRKINQQ